MQERAPRTEEPVRTLLPRRVLTEEVLVVLSLSLLASAVFAILDLLSAPVRRSVAVATFPSYTGLELAKELADIAFSLAPVWLVFHLVRRSGEGPKAIGFDAERPTFDAATGFGLAVLVGGIGYGLYAAAIKLNINRFVVPVPPEHHWWTIPVLVLGAVQFALLEETVVAGYLITRLRQLGWGAAAAVGASAVLRGSYHLYQGWGGFGGNVLLGVFFGTIFLRWRRAWPLVVAHFLVDTAAGVGYIAFKHHLPGIH